MNQAEFFSRFLNDRVILRCRDAGVHMGRLLAVYCEGGCKLAVLEQAVRLWSWAADAEDAERSFTLSGIASNGVPEGSRLGTEIPIMAIEGWCEIIPLSEKAEKTISAWNIVEPPPSDQPTPESQLSAKKVKKR